MDYKINLLNNNKPEVISIKNSHSSTNDDRRTNDTCSFPSMFLFRLCVRVWCFMFWRRKNHQEKMLLQNIVCSGPFVNRCSLSFWRFQSFIILAACFSEKKIMVISVIFFRSKKRLVLVVFSSKNITKHSTVMIIVHNRIQMFINTQINTRY